MTIPHFTVQHFDAKKVTYDEVSKKKLVFSTSCSLCNFSTNLRVPETPEL